MKEQKYKKIVKWKSNKDTKDIKGIVFMVFIWITMTKFMDSWYFNLFEYALLVILLIWAYERKVYWVKIK